MQHDSLIRRSSGLCVAFGRNCYFESSVRGSRGRGNTATLAARLCGIFLDKAYNKIKELVIPVSQTTVSHAKFACIKDLRVSNNKAVSDFEIINTFISMFHFYSLLQVRSYFFFVMVYIERR
jgi:hypothetical protein